MALGGGIFTSQNKKLPGTYVNFVGTQKPLTLGERGTVAVALDLDWGDLGKINSLSHDSFLKRSKKLLGAAYADDAMLPLREIFCHANKVLLYRLGSGGTAASNTYGTAKYAGTFGNKIITTITATTDGENQTGWIVETYVDGELIDTQKADKSAKTDALNDNDYVAWKSNVALAAATKTTGAMSGGVNPTAATSHSGFLAALQNYTPNVIACSSATETIIAEYVAFAKDSRDSRGVKCQVVVHGTAADYEGVINSATNLTGESTSQSGKLVYWVAGAEAGCAVNASCQNMIYDGELDVDADGYSQDDLIAALESGKFVFHRVGDDVRVLDDINSLTTFTADKSEDFGSNQTIRVLDQLANDVARTYNTRYIGAVQNDAAGREALWSDIVTLCNELQNVRAIENFDAKDIEVLAGETKKSVVVNMAVTPVNAMSQLYCTIYVN